MDEYSSLKLKIEEYLKNPSTKREILQYLLSIKEFKDFEDFKHIIGILLDVEDILIDFPQKIFEKIKIGQSSYSKETVNKFLVLFLKEDSAPEKNYRNFFYPLLPHLNTQTEQDILTPDQVKDICNSRLKRYVAGKGDDIEIAFNLFYSCWEKVDKDNVVHITEEALKNIRQFINKVPEQYLKFLIRPRYTPPHRGWDGDFYSFVFEPFTEKIFGGWDNFLSFLEELKAKGIDQSLVSGIEKSYRNSSENSYQVIKVNNVKEMAELGIDEKWIQQVRNIEDETDSNSPFP